MKVDCSGINLTCIPSFNDSVTYLDFFLQNLLTKTVEKVTKDTSTHILQSNRLSLKERKYNVRLYIMHTTRLQMYMYTT